MVALHLLLLAASAAVYVASCWAMKPSLRVIKARGYGIVALELARTPAEVQRIRRAWRTDGDAAARRSIVVDFGFIAGYGGFFVTLAWWCAAVAHRIGTVWARLGWVLVVAFAVAAACDVLENVGMLAELRVPGVVPAHWPPVVGAVAQLKWALLYLGPLPLLTLAVAVVAGD